MQSCNNCYIHDNNLFTCFKCKVAMYCSSNCQRADWKIHKSTCIKKDEDPYIDGDLIVNTIAHYGEFSQIVTSLHYTHIKCAKTTLIGCQIFKSKNDPGTNVCTFFVMSTSFIPKYDELINQIGNKFLIVLMYPNSSLTNWKNYPMYYTKIVKIKEIDKQLNGLTLPMSIFVTTDKIIGSPIVIFP